MLAPPSPTIRARGGYFPFARRERMRRRLRTALFGLARFFSFFFVRFPFWAGIVLSRAGGQAALALNEPTGH